jgi:centractin
MDGKLEYLKLPIIIDIGSSEIKAGFSGEEKPKVLIKNYFGEPKYKKIIRTFDIKGKEKTDQYIGEDCDKFLGLIKLRYPVVHGSFQNEADILTIFSHIFNKLGITSQEIKEHPVLVTDPILNPYKNREKIAHSLLDNLGVPAIFFASQPLLSLFSTSATSGTVLESGEGVTQSCVVYEGYSIPSSYERFNYGGGDVNDYLKLLLKNKGYHFYNSTEIQLINDIKENLCYLEINKRNMNDNKQSYNIKSTPYYLPDGSNISIGEERIIAPEMLFYPEYIGREYLGFADMIMSSINKIDIDLKKNSYENIWLSGGNTAFKELKEKLVDELKNKLDKGIGINVYENEKIKPQHRCWVGGNIISILEIFKKMWVTRNDWNEKGSEIVHIKTI